MIKERKINYKAILTVAAAVLFILMIILILKKITTPKLPEINTELLNDYTKEVLI